MKPRFKPLERPECEETWFCYFVAPRGPGKPSALTKAISQVPDLNHGKKGLTNLEAKKISNRGKAHPNDSKYIRLAKAGGRKNLLDFHENKRREKEPGDYPVPEWYCDNFEEPEVENGGVGNQQMSKTISTKYERPEWMSYIEYDPSADNKPSKYQSRRPLIGYDALSTWKRDELERRMKQKAIKETAIRFKIQTDHKDHHGKTKSGKKYGRPKASQRINKDVSISKEAPRLPKLTKRQLLGQRKLSGADLAVRWYDKWYILQHVD